MFKPNIFMLLNKNKTSFSHVKDTVIKMPRVAPAALRPPTLDMMAVNGGKKKREKTKQVFKATAWAIWCVCVEATLGNTRVGAHML